MKKMATLLLSLSFFSPFAFSAAKEVLQTRLAKVNQFYARFTQVVTSPDKTVIQEASGELRLKRPNLVNWHTEAPEESLLVSDGSTVWMYTPQVAQVTASPLSSVVSNSLLLLISQNTDAAWENYRITQKDDRFTLVPKEADQPVYEIKVLPTGMLSDFAIIETDGQKSFYDLTHQSLKAQEGNYFTFTIPTGVTLDDQR